MEVFRLIRLLKEKYPKAYVSIGVDYTSSPRREGITYEYTLYIKHDNGERLAETFEHFRELREFVHMMTNTLSYKRVMNYKSNE